jgi:hypothetical protein
VLSKEWTERKRKSSFFQKQQTTTIFNLIPISRIHRGCCCYRFPRNHNKNILQFLFKAYVRSSLGLSLSLSEKKERKEWVESNGPKRRTKMKIEIDVLHLAVRSTHTHLIVKLHFANWLVTFISSFVNYGEDEFIQFRFANLQWLYLSLTYFLLWRRRPLHRARLSID